MPFVSNARMYAVSPETETAWRDLIAHVAEDAGTAFEYVGYPAPQPLEDLWRRDDLGCVQMCGYPIALDLADVVPLASPIPAASWAGGRALSRTDLIVRDDAPFRTLSDTFGGTVGWTVAHSQSGFNALRYHLLRYRSEDRPRLYLHSVGNLVTARRILDSVVDGRIDIGPLDAYWHMLVRKYLPELTEKRTHTRIDRHRTHAGFRDRPGDAPAHDRSSSQGLCGSPCAALVRPVQRIAIDRRI